MTVYGYLRVSTDKQDCDNQKIGVEELAKKQGVPIESWIIDDGVSGTKEPEKRKLGKLLKRIKSGDVIICSELSRLGRRLFMVISILEHCMKIGAKVLTVKDGYELGDNVQSKILAFAFGLVAELEREMISKRTKEALQRRKMNGGNWADRSAASTAVTFWTVRNPKSAQNWQTAQPSRKSPKNTMSEKARFTGSYSKKTLVNFGKMFEIWPR